MAWFTRRREPEQPLIGARPRIKTYSAESGHVYQYTFAGQRTVVRPQPGTQYVFDFSGERADAFRISVLVSEAAAGAWSRANARSLAAGERYAIAKLAMQRLLDAREPGAGSADIAPAPEDVQSILDELGV